MNSNPISFDNTEIAFAHRSDNALKKAYRLFTLMGKPWLVALGTRITPWAIRARLPVNPLIRATIFRQFVGGETLEETADVVGNLAGSNVQVILDYGAEGKDGEEAFDHACKEFIKVIDYASTQPNIPYMSIKVTGFARFSLLQKLDELMHASTLNSLVKRYNNALEQLPAEEKEEWNRVYQRMGKICEAAAGREIGVLVDAEESWVQDPVDALTMLMMDKYNRGTLVLYNTAQLYRHDRLLFLVKMCEAAKERNFLLGVKLVRGAYMEKERKRAEEKGYESPIQANKRNTDNDYDSALKLCIENISHIGVIIATHNEGSNLLATELLRLAGLPINHPHIHFSQLYGMSDNITFNLARAGCSVSKYLPFGPIKDVIPYLMRRAQENTSVKGQTGRELSLIKKELKRRHSR
ncbi:MAG TPA: proline dehydrogenase family protein [Chitinophagaceae bacterium]|nr:proline dehydrogenase family protein [Chitinophagaceae bacterium]